MVVGLDRNPKYTLIVISLRHDNSCQSWEEYDYMRPPSVAPKPFTPHPWWVRDTTNRIHVNENTFDPTPTTTPLAVPSSPRARYETDECP